MEASLYSCNVERVPAGTDMPVTVAACPVCEGRSARPTFTINGLTSQVVVCEQCGLGSLHPMPSEARIADFYPREYYGETGEKFEPLVEKMVRIVAARHAKFLVNGLQPGDRILDVGCGRGVLLRAFADLGFEGHGIEISEAAAEGADPRLHIRIENHLRQAEYDDGFFDRIVIWHVLEHLTDPGETLQEIHRILKPGGRVIVAVPNFSSLQARWAGPAWFHLDLPRHLYHFPVAALQTLLQNRSFECRAEHHFSLRQNPFGWVQSALNRSRSLPRNSLYTLLQLAGGHDSSNFDSGVRLRLRLAYYLGMPIALGLTLLTTLFRTGATIHIVAEKK